MGKVFHVVATVENLPLFKVLPMSPLYRVSLFWIFITHALNAQTFVATYEADHKTITAEIMGKTCELYFTKDTAIFIHKDYPTESNLKIDGTTATKIIGDANGAPILTLPRQGIQRYKELYAASKQLLIIEEPIAKIDWKIIGPSEPYLNTGLHKATGQYGGRTYEVWFNPELPFSYGPHRLNGLPGLITRAESTDGVVKYELVGFRKLQAHEKETSLFELGAGISIKPEEIKSLIIKKLLKVEAMTTDKLRYTSQDPLPNYTIEKNRWTIISTYKAERGY